jgi:hypothetical protein
VEAHGVFSDDLRSLMPQFVHKNTNCRNKTAVPFPFLTCKSDLIAELGTVVVLSARLLQWKTLRTLTPTFEIDE